MNHEQFAEEVKKGLHDPKKVSAKKPKKAATPKPAEGSLFVTGDDKSAVPAHYPTEWDK